MSAKNANSRIYLLCAGIIVFSLSIYNTANFFLKEVKIKRSVKVLAAQRDPEAEINYWNAFVEKHPQYVDGWIELTKLYLSTGKNDLASKSLKISESLDPNNKEVIKLQSELP